MRILAIPASNSRNGINRQIVGYAARLLEAGLVPSADVEILDLNDYEMPIYSTERQQLTGIPEPALRFYEKIGSVDAVVISYAEHNGSYTVAWKNVYDWASRQDMAVYQGKRVAMFASSPGARGGSGVLQSATTSAPFFGADLVGSLSIPSFNDNFDSDAGELSDPELRSRFEKVLGALADPSHEEPRPG